MTMPPSLTCAQNNTIFGTQFKTFPTQTPPPLVADMSLDILFRELTIAYFGVIFSGAHNNIGPDGAKALVETLKVNTSLTSITL